MTPISLTTTESGAGRVAPWLAALESAGDSAQALQNVLESHGLDRAALLQWAPAVIPQQPYNRKVLGLTPGCEVMLARWTPGVRCAPHDHGRASGWVWYLRGEFQETTWSCPAGLWQARQITEHKDNTLTAIQSGAVHDCICDCDGVSLHIYRPAIRAMQVLDPVGRQTITVADHCGAWLPADRADWLRITKW